MRTTKNQLRKNIEEAKIKEENNIHDIRDLEEKIPKRNAKMVELEEKEKSLKSELLKIQEDFDLAEMQLLETKNELENAKTMAVSDQEVESIIHAKEVIEKQLEEQDQITAAGRQKLKENSRAIEEANAITTKMEALHSSFNMDAGDTKTKNKQVENLQIEINSLKAKISKNRLDLESITQNLQMKSDSLAKFIEKRDEIKKSFSAKEAEQRKELKEKENQLRKLRSKETALAATHQRLKDEQQLVFKLASNAIKHISNNLFEDKSQSLN